MTALAIEGLRKTFRDPQQGRHVHAVDDINLAIATGEFVSLLGPGGCGKTPTAPMRGGSGVSDQARPNAPALPDFDRVTSAPQGNDGGVAGANGGVPLKSGPALRPKGFQVIPNGDRLVLYMPGGGGMGDPAQRDPALVADDVRDGVISVQTAREAYKVVCFERGVIDLAATQQSRAGATSRS